MRSSALSRGLALLAMSSLTACAGPGRAVFDAAAVPAPPQYTDEFKRGLAAEIDAAPRADLILEALTDASQFYGRIRRLKNKEKADEKQA